MALGSAVMLADLVHQTARVCSDPNGTSQYRDADSYQSCQCPLLYKYSSFVTFVWQILRPHPGESVFIYFPGLSNYRYNAVFCMNNLETSLSVSRK